MLNVVYCIPSLYNSGGMERVLTVKTNYMAEQFGWKVSIVTTCQKKRPLFYDLSDKINLYDLDIDYETINKAPLFRKIVLRNQARKSHIKKLSNLLYELHSDVVVSMFTHEATFLYKIQDGSKKVLEFHFSRNYRELDTLYNNKGFLQSIIDKYLHWRDNKIPKKYDKFVVLSHKDAKAWGEMSNLSVIYNPITLKSNAFPVKKRHKILAVGRLCPQKGFDLLIKIWNLILASDREGWSVRIIGSGPDKEKLQQQIEDMHLSDSISIVSPTNCLDKEYAESDLFCFTSRYEGVPLVLIEALEAGVPAISFDCPCGPSEIIDNNQTGYLVPIGNIMLFAEYIKKLISSESLRIEMGSKAKKQMNEKFGLEIIMSQWKSLFETIIS